jgi:dTDP-4-amino-4,6-dideoxygalactose transaminase
MADFTRQFLPLRLEILDAIAEVCDAQSYILGPQVARFEAAVASACASPFAVGCSSGTDALWLALAASGIGDSTEPRGSERYTSLTKALDSEIWEGSHNRRAAVITSPFSFFATASAILRAGARPLFGDIDPHTFNLSAPAVAKRLASPEGEDVRAILPVHLFGQCSDWDAFAALKSNHPNLLLIEDAAQAFGATWTSPGQSPRPAGSLGDAAAFSFYPTKNLAAMGDAGMVTTSIAEVDRRLRSLRAHGMTRRYFHDEVGWNSRLDSIQAAILNVKLRYLPTWNRQRRDRAASYDRLFRAAGLAESLSAASESKRSTEEGIVLPYTDPRATHVFHQYVIRAPRRDALRDHLTACGIGSEIYYPVPLHLQTAIKGLGYKPGDFPESERAAAEVLALPIYPEIRDDEQQAVVEAIRTFYA